MNYLKLWLAAFNYLFELVEAYVHYWDDLYGYPWGRIYILGLLTVSAAFWFEVWCAVLQPNPRCSFIWETMFKPLLQA